MNIRVQKHHVLLNHRVCLLKTLQNELHGARSILVSTAHIDHVTGARIISDQFLT
jgi:hypothetical protein